MEDLTTCRPDEALASRALSAGSAAGRRPDAGNSRIASLAGLVTVKVRMRDSMGRRWVSRGSFPAAGLSDAIEILSPSLTLGHVH